MKTLLKKALSVSDQAEAFHLESQGCRMSIENGILKDLGGGINSGYALRVIKGRTLGTSFLNNLKNRDRAVEGAKISMVGKVAADFEFPGQPKTARIDTYDKRVESLSYSDLEGTSEIISDFFHGKVKGQMNQYLGFVRFGRRIENTNGLSLESRTSYVYTSVGLVYPRTSYGTGRSFYRKGPSKVPRKELQELLDHYDATIPLVSVGTGRYPVLLMPDALFPILWRIYEGANGRNIFKKASPLTGKLGKRVFAEGLNIFDNPLDTTQVNAEAFDDEGVPTQKLDIVKNGVFKNCFANLDYSAKLKMKPTGNGFRSTFFLPGNPIRIQPAPLLRHMCVGVGKDKFSDMVGSMTKGIIVEDVIGPHSGNILNGDFSVGLCPGILVKNGEMVGRVRDGMISGNIYDLLKDVAGIEDRPHFKDDPNTNPCVLLDSVKVSAK